MLRYSPTIKRMIRQDPPELLGRPTRPFLEAALRERRLAEAKEWLDYLLVEAGGIHYLLGTWSWYMVQALLEGKREQWPGLARETLAPWLTTTAGSGDLVTAEVQADGTSARLSARGMPYDIHLVEGDHRYLVAVGTAVAQAEERAAWQQQILDAGESGDKAAWRTALDALRLQDRLIHDILSDWTWALMTAIVGRWGEEHLGEIQRQTEEPWVTVRYAAMADMSAEESLQLSVEAHRGHFAGPLRDGSVTVRDEPGRYVIQLDQCGSGARMVQGDAVVGTPSRYEPPYNFARIEGAYNWTWGLSGVGAYCSHCAVVNQIIPIERLGRPMRGTAFSDRPESPCQWFIYKEPLAAPDESFAQVGKQRPERGGAA
jgi:hypothetical protein